MNYPLTEFTEHELQILTRLLQNEIEAKEAFIEKAKEYIPAGQILDDTTRKDRQAVATMKEINVRVLTALGMVACKNKILSN